MSFSKQIRDFNAKARKAATLVLRGSALEIFSAVIRRTPVKTGRLRGNWQCEINRIPSGTVDQNGAQALNEVNKETSQMELNDNIYLMNNLPYAQVIEEGRSDQAPAGMVRVTIAEWRYLVMRKAKGFK